MSERRTLDELMAEAGARIERLEPQDAYASVVRGACLVDIRSDAPREAYGIVPGSLHVPRTVLEWRLAPDSPWRNPHAGGLDTPIVVMCDHGFSSVLAAATLRELGFEQVADVVGGYEAWQEAGLPTAAAPPRSADALPGMAPPDR